MLFTLNLRMNGPPKKWAVRALPAPINVSERDSYVIVAQLSPEFTGKLVDRWQELEEQAVHPVALPSYAETLCLYAD